MDTQFIQEPVTVTVDLTGLPDETIRHVRELVDAARRGQEAGRLAETRPVPGTDEWRSMLGRFAHEAKGSMSAEEIKAARREVWGLAPEAAAPSVPE